jgi:predicted YcjX-like family ATPase
MNRIKLGQEVKDRITGFQGIVVSITDFLNGCKRPGVQSKWEPGKELLGAEMFDEPVLELIGNGIKKEEKPKETHRDPNFRPFKFR